MGAQISRFRSPVETQFAGQQDGLQSGAAIPREAPARELPPELWCKILQEVPPPTKRRFQWKIGDLGALRRVSRSFRDNVDIAHPGLREQISSGFARAFVRGETMGAADRNGSRLLHSATTIDLSYMRRMKLAKVSDLFDLTPSVQTLNLRGNGNRLGGSIDKIKFDRVPSIECLDLSHNWLVINDLTEIPVEKLSGVRTLVLDWNVINDVSAFTTRPLPNLRMLSLKNPDRRMIESVPLLRRQCPELEVVRSPRHGAF